MLSPNPIKITVIIGVLNMKCYLANALNSIINQCYPNIELIVMDGGSTDGTIEVIQRYNKYITFWKSEKDNGHADACNKAIDIASGDFILLLNADDTLADNLLTKAAAVYAKNTKAKMITCGVKIITIDPQQREHVVKVITESDKLQISLYNMMFELPVINARFFHREIFKQFGKFHSTHADGSYNLSNDREFLIKLALAGIQSEIIPEPLYIYLSHQESLTFSKKHVIKSHNEHIKLADKFITTTPVQPDEKKLLMAWRAKERGYLSLLYFFQGDFKKSFLSLKDGIQQYPLIWLKQFTLIILAGIYRKLTKWLQKIYQISFKNTAT